MEDDLRAMIEENTKMLKSIQRSQRIGALFSFLRFLIILIPFILAAVYLPGLVDEYRQSYEDSLLGESIRLPQGFEIGDLQEYLERN